MTTLSDRLDAIESALNKVNDTTRNIPTEIEINEARKEIFFEIEEFQTKISSIELQVSMLEEVVNLA